VDGTGSKVRVSEQNKASAALGLNVYLDRLSDRRIGTIGIPDQERRRVHSMERHKDGVSREAGST
jgi:hypothetical protein